ncbi:hypothetical protein TNIN_119151 [Trichonephila inaurata madagascariensis]|uniref:Uncharacterized protein n=1 Tax=Trichonephila inaurata madagascariensis TaxID=2747483 RepID=A0A8X7BS83_9ARAC|nr:hypothetical protein TNIN_119151 [Trichonephila inaurata madagascariensis]
MIISDRKTTISKLEIPPYKIMLSVTTSKSWGPTFFRCNDVGNEHRWHYIIIFDYANFRLSDFVNKYKYGIGLHIGTPTHYAIMDFYGNTMRNI